MLRKTYIEDPNFRMRPRRLSDKAMSELYSSRPIVSSDCVLIQEKTKSVFLTTRIIEPAKGLWVIGGNRLAGESAAATAVRKIREEAGLDVSQERLKEIGIVEYISPTRTHPPQNEGRHDIMSIFSLRVSDKEIEQAQQHLDPKEYDLNIGLRKFSSIKELEDASVRENIIDYYREIFE